MARSKAFIPVPNCNNLQGFIMPDARSGAVLTLAQRHDIVIFEDDTLRRAGHRLPASAHHSLRCGISTAG